MPNAQDTLLMGYTANQMKAIKENTGDIWSFLSSQNRLFSSDPSMTKAILTESSYNDYFGEDIPGNVGKYIGYLIVKSYMKKKPEVTLQQLMKTSNKTIFNESDYKPH